MKNSDKGSAVFCFLLSFFAFVQSLRLGIGTPQNPGMGFIAFAASGLLGLLSIFLFIQASLSKEKAEVGPAFSGMSKKKVLCILIALVLYAKLMPIVGYLISTFLLMSFLFWIVRGRKWWSVVASSLLTAVITHYVFSVWLNCQFPAGLFGP